MTDAAFIHTLADELDTRLRAAADPVRAAAEKRYLKSDLAFYGTGVPGMRRIARAVRIAHPGLDRGGVIALVEELWRLPIHERRLAAVELLIVYKRLLTPADIALVERLLREARTWALVDDLAPNVAAPLLDRHPELKATLDRWATDPDFWIRRAALLTLLPGLRRGAGDFTRFSRYADAMLEEREFFIRKAIGWVLREVSKKQPDLVYDWLRPRAARASSVTLREALKYLPAEQREALKAAGNPRAGRTR